MCADKIDIDQLRKSLRKRHAAAEKLKSASQIQRPGHQPVVYSRNVASKSPAPRPSPFAPLNPVNLETAVDGRDMRGPDGAYSFLVESHLNTSTRDEAALSTALVTAMSDPDGALRGHLLKVDPLGGAEVEPEDMVFFDLETTGLSSSPVFLIGVMIWADGGLMTRQFFARDYSEERAIVSLFAECMQGKKMLVSFNGKSFDLPYIRARAAAVGVEFEFDGPHFDLLHISRRAWKDKLPNCKLQTLEAHICGRHRTGDIPGHAIPQAYHDYVHSKDARHMVSALEHNRLDLVTLAELMIHLPGE
jgi:uncharacterized protein YprB with RNaseH-like and TPR domain